MRDTSCISAFSSTEAVNVMITLPAAVSLISMLLAPNTGTAAITFRVQGRTIEATLRAPRAAFAQWPAGAPAAFIAGSCNVRADQLTLQPERSAIRKHRELAIAQADTPSDSMLTAVVRYKTDLSPRTLDVSCALFPSQTSLAPHPNLVVVLAGGRGRTALIAANAEGRVDAGMRLGY